MKPTPSTVGLLLSALVFSALGGCFRGGVSSSPPVHLVLDMDFQPKVKAQAKTPFAGFHDGRGMRLPVPGTIARGTLPDPSLANRDASKAFVTKNPVPISQAVLDRGHELFDIHCSVCHGYSGRGGGASPDANGMVGRRWPVAIPSFHYDPNKDEVANRVPLMPDGEFFEVITNGKNTMPAYGPRIAPEDRWAIVHYIRVLQSLSK